MGRTGARRIFVGRGGGRLNFFFVGAEIPIKSQFYVCQGCLRALSWRAIYFRVKWV